MDLGAGEAAQAGDAELLGEGVDAGVLEELVARVVDLGLRGVLLEDALPGELAREVLARIEVFEEAAGRIDVFALELDLPRLVGVAR